MRKKERFYPLGNDLSKCYSELNLLSVDQCYYSAKHPIDEAGLRFFYLSIKAIIGR